MPEPPPAPAMLRVLGLTGGVGAGKSSVARRLGAALGGQIHDADAIVGGLLATPAVIAELEEAFSTPLRQADGQLDRSALGALVFAEEGARKRLEAILHPRVRRQLAQDLLRQAEEAPGSWAILDIPLLREGGLDRLCQFILHVDTPAAERQRRATERHGWTPEVWQAREAAQLPVQEKRRLADAVLPNGPNQAPDAALPAALLHQLRAFPAVDLAPLLSPLAC